MSWEVGETDVNEDTRYEHLIVSQDLSLYLSFEQTEQTSHLFIDLFIISHVVFHFCIYVFSLWWKDKKKALKKKKKKYWRQHRLRTIV